jgi:hypothetical protein
MSKKLSEVFDIEPVQKNLPSIQNPASDVELESDSALAAKNMRELLQLGQEAVKRAYEMADESENPRGYEALSTILKTVGDMNAQLLDLHDKKKKIKNAPGSIPTAGQIPTGNTTNIAFVGTTADLMNNIFDRMKNK